ncbi:dephospho-CoA kinase [uncultured Fibrobacter sp.]|jgi:dephospho-CoA kinase|uniref:dephospho-CoA kinase n=1 Tax=uncultured Fibrobacter sp. TaxID=261512 RepID=UPI0025D0CC43|nr:dephospho-CoA kinase [uncultured Fibrobacter sp.]
MRKIGIVGSIGAGKSFVGTLLRDRGFRVMDADEVVHELYRTSNDLRAVIRCAFGPYCLTQDGVNREFFADLIFRDSDARRRLESLVYPYLTQAVLDFFEEPERPSERGIRFFSAALLDRVPEIVKVLDEIWAVTAPEDIRLKRLIARGLSEDDARRRMETQRMNALPSHPNIRVVENISDEGALWAQIADILGNV